jgi:soluble cytochrome b562
MKQETITNAVEVINRNITKYEIELDHLLETKENDDDSQIKKTKDIICDLKKIKESIQNDKLEVKLEYCYYFSHGIFWLYPEIDDVLQEANFNFDEKGSTPDSTILIPRYELDEEDLRLIASLKSLRLSKS